MVRACAGADFITTRPIIRSKGVVTWIEVTDGIRASPSFPYLDLRKSRHDKKMYFYAVQWLAKRVSTDTNGVKHTQQQANADRVTMLKICMRLRPKQPSRRQEPDYSILTLRISNSVRKSSLSVIALMMPSGLHLDTMVD